MEESDASLVGRARLGDAEAFGSLVRRHLQAAYAVALARLGEPADAEDVCQDAFIQALERLDDCRQPDRFLAWLIAIVRNRALDHQRFLAVRHSVPLDTAILRSSDNPERNLEASEIRASLLDAMRGLTELQREVMLLYDFEGWSHREVAERLEISEGSARVHLHNGRKALRARLGAQHKEDV
jgi:RNA polymerase sigma-70 factor (ECF subfamily)